MSRGCDFKKMIINCATWVSKTSLELWLAWMFARFWSARKSRVVKVITTNKDWIIYMVKLKSYRATNGTGPQLDNAWVISREERLWHWPRPWWKSISNVRAGHKLSLQPCVISAPWFRSQQPCDAPALTAARAERRRRLARMASRAAQKAVISTRHVTVVSFVLVHINYTADGRVEVQIFIPLGEEKAGWFLRQQTCGDDT